MIPIKGRGFTNQGSGLGFRMQPLILQEGYQYGVQDFTDQRLYLFVYSGDLWSSYVGFLGKSLESRFPLK